MMKHDHVQRQARDKPKHEGIRKMVSSLVRVWFCCAVVFCFVVCVCVCGVAGLLQGARRRAFGGWYVGCRHAPRQLRSSRAAAERNATATPADVNEPDVNE
jgi:hypothetical protein